MAKNKSASGKVSPATGADEDAGAADEIGRANPTSTAATGATRNDSAPLEAGKKRRSSAKAPTIEPSSPSLIICRNKSVSSARRAFLFSFPWTLLPHVTLERLLTLTSSPGRHWRYISAFHGPWLQMPIEILETIANINYNTARPRPINPASLFDLVKVRRLVEEATNLAVRAASDIASPILTNVHGGFPDPSSSNLTGLAGSGHGAKLSRERKFRMREQASQKLARAYRLDEIACSVATMQGASPLEEVGKSVLQRNSRDPDAKYVHFFHEKIPSRQLAECTSLDPLTDIIEDRPTEPEVLRTRATVRVFKEDHDGAAQDLTHALSVNRFHRPSHTAPSQDDSSLQEAHRVRRRHQDVILAEKDHPSSLEGQILFHRGAAYLTLACQHVLEGLPSKSPKDVEADDNEAQRDGAADAKEAKSLVMSEKYEKSEKGEQSRAESRKTVKVLAKRALRDYMGFIAEFEYSPNLPISHVKEFNDRINLAVHGSRHTRSPDANVVPEPHTVYSLADLFAAIPPPDLPPYPAQDLVTRNSTPSRAPEAAATCESTTYHPLLSDALHSLLLCHCLVQTSPKELQRHAYMVARLMSLSDGYPVFQASRSPSRSDWLDVLRRTNNWLDLSSTWETLCTPAPIPLFDSQPDKGSSHSPQLAAAAAAAVLNGGSAESIAEDLRRERVREQAVIDAMSDDRVTDEASFRAAIMAREKRAQEEFNAASRNNAAGAATPGAKTNGDACHNQSRLAPNPSNSRWSGEDGREYPILTDRAACIAQWVCEAPVVTGTAKRKKKAKRPGKLGGVEAVLGKLSVEGTSGA